MGTLLEAAISGSQMSLLLETASELRSMIYASLFHC